MKYRIDLYKAFKHSGRDAYYLYLQLGYRIKQKGCPYRHRIKFHKDFVELFPEDKINRDCKVCLKLEEIMGLIKTPAIWILAGINSDYIGFYLKELIRCENSK